MVAAQRQKGPGAEKFKLDRKSERFKGKSSTISVIWLFWISFHNFEYRGSKWTAKDALNPEHLQAGEPSHQGGSSEPELQLIDKLHQDGERVSLAR